MISEFIVSRASGKPTIVVAAAMATGGPNTAFDRVVNISLDVQWLSDLASQLAGAPGTRVIVMDARDGAVLARTADTGGVIGRAVPDSPIPAAFQARGEGTIQAPTLDGTIHLPGFTSLSRAPRSSIMVAVGVPKDAVLATLDRRLIETLGAVGIVMMFGFPLAAPMANRLLMRPLID